MSQPTTTRPPTPAHHEVRITGAGLNLEGALDVPIGARALVLFAHGSGSSRHSSRNQRVARSLQASGLATLLFDLLTAQEERIDAASGHLRFDVGLLASRLQLATIWTLQEPLTAHLRLGYFGASTGAAAALIAAAESGSTVGAVVSRGGRPDLAGPALERVSSPTLLIVGGDDEPVVGLNQEAYDRLRGLKRFEIVPGATHLFEEPGALDRVAGLAASWFATHLGDRRT